MDKPTMWMCIAFVFCATFYGGIVFQRRLQFAEMKETIEFYNRLVQFQNRLTEMMNEVESVRKTSCGKVEA
jgi:hypothetical protein